MCTGSAYFGVGLSEDTGLPTLQKSGLSFLLAGNALRILQSPIERATDRLTACSTYGCSCRLGGRLPPGEEVGVQFHILSSWKHSGLVGSLELRDVSHFVSENRGADMIPTGIEGELSQPLLLSLDQMHTEDDCAVRCIAASQMLRRCKCVGILIATFIEKEDFGFRAH